MKTLVLTFKLYLFFWSTKTWTLNLLINSQMFFLWTIDMIIFIFLFSILYTLDKKPINIIIDFIGIILSLALFLLNINIIDLSFISYIIIIIYASALAIIFGIIVMLYNSDKDIKIKPQEPNLFFFPFKLLFSSSPFFLSKIFSSFSLFFFFFFLSFLLFKFFLLFFDSFFFFESYYLFLPFSSDILFLIFNYLFNNPFFFFYIILIINILLFALIGIIFITIS